MSKIIRLFNRVIMLAMLATALILLFAYPRSGMTEDSVPCNSCEETYHDCLIGAETQMQECRRNGGDEQQCENGRVMAEQTCQNNRTYCWNTCAQPKASPSPPSWCTPYWETVGAIESIDANGNLTGWASDPDSRVSPLNVEIYVDGDRGTGRFAGSSFTNIPRPDLNLPGTPGFNIAIYEQYRDGQPHVFTAYASGYCTGTIYNEIGSMSTTLYP